MRKEKRLALQAILLSMEEVKVSIETKYDVQELRSLADSMRELAKAFALVENSKNSGVRL